MRENMFFLSFPRSAVTLIHKSAGVQIFRFGNAFRVQI